MILRKPRHTEMSFEEDAASGLLVPKKTIATISGPRLEMDGHFTIRAVSSRGSRVLADFDNLLLDSGLERLGTGSAFTHVQLGTGSTTPAVSQTALAAFAASTSNQTDQVDSYVAGPPVYHQCIRSFRFVAGTATGTFSEIGVGWASSGSLFSRALILDGGGSPTTITVLSDEALDVDYRFRIYPNTADVTGTLTLSGVGYGYTLRPGLISTLAGAWAVSSVLGSGFVIGTSGQLALYGASMALGPTTGQLTGATNNGTMGSFNYSAYVGGSLSRAGIITTGLTGGNTGFGIKGFHVLFGGYGYYQCLFSTIIPKDGTKIMTHGQRITWARRP